MLTFYEKTLSELEGLKNLNVDKVQLRAEYISLVSNIDYKKNGTLKLMFGLNNCAYRVLQEDFFKHLNTEEEMERLNSENVFNNGKYIVSNILLSSKEIMIYRLLLSHYIETSINGKASISIDELHLKLRQKCFKYGKEKYEKETLREYHNTFIKLSLKTIHLNFSQCRAKVFSKYKYNNTEHIRCSLLNMSISFEELKTMNTNNRFQYDLGEYGMFIKRGKHYNSLLPVSIYKLNFNQIDTFDMAIYIGTMIYLNKRKKQKHSIYLKSILEAINKYDKNGLPISKTYIEYISKLEPKKRVKVMEQLKHQISFIFDELVKEEKIKEYEFQGKWSYKYMMEKELKIKIVFLSDKA